MKYLYKKFKSDIPSNSFDDINIQIFTPKIFRGLTLKGENKSLKLIGVRLLFWAITCGRARVYYATKNEELVHTSYVIPKCLKFPFLNKQDYEIGPCFTYPKFRGKGIYPAMLQYICSSEGDNSTVFYMIVDEGNTSSIRGIEKSGFERCGNVKVSRVLKRYKIEQAL